MTTIHQFIDDAPEIIPVPPALRHQRIEIVFRLHPSDQGICQGGSPSFFDATRDDCGAIKGGPDDVSRNPDYLAGLGE